MHAHQTEHGNDAGRGGGFAIGLLAGACVGTGLALWLAPGVAAQLRRRAIDSANDPRQRTSDTCEQVSTWIAKTADDVARETGDVPDNAADVVAHGAREVERSAKVLKT